MHARLMLAVLSACGFEAGVLPDSDASLQGGEDAGDASSQIDAVLIDSMTDATPPIPFAPLHVPTASNAPGTAALSLTATHSIDTTMLQIDGAAPGAGITFDTAAQDPSGPDLAILHVSALTIGNGAIVSVGGTHPLVVIASGEIQIAGSVDGGAFGFRPGPGGALADMGAQPGGNGQHVDTFLDGGGGGAGHATAGGTGGLASGGGFTANGGAAGGVGGTQQVTALAGASGGGHGLGGTSGTTAGCMAAGGGGGGALQLSSATAIRITAGGITVGGGGGAGGIGTVCFNRGSGGGGGAGGALVVQAPIVELGGSALLAANGGGGGGGGAANVDGVDGGNGQLAIVGGTFGAGVGAYGANGGTGGSGNAPVAGSAHTAGDGNGGGGGGAAGRIAVFHSTNGSATLTGMTSPAAFVSTY